MAAALCTLLRGGTATADLLATGFRIAAAILLAATGGLLAGLALHARPRLRGAVEPVLASWNAIPSVMFYPVLLVLFGVGSGAIVAVAVLFALAAMVVATLAGLDRIPAVLLRTARALRLRPAQTAWRIRLPSIAPDLFTGLKLVVSYALVGVVAAEFILSGSGVGYAIANAYNNFDNRTMYALMLLVVLVVTAVNAILGALDARFRDRVRPRLAG